MNSWVQETVEIVIFTQLFVIYLNFRMKKKNKRPATQPGDVGLGDEIVNNDENYKKTTLYG